MSQSLASQATYLPYHRDLNSNLTSELHAGDNDVLTANFDERVARLLVGDDGAHHVIKLGGACILKYKHLVLLQDFIALLEGTLTEHSHHLCKEFGLS